MPGRIRVLNVAEKPSVSREVSNCLSGGTARRLNAGYMVQASLQLGLHLVPKQCPVLQAYPELCF